MIKDDSLFSEYIQKYDEYKDEYLSMVSHINSDIEQLFADETPQFIEWNQEKQDILKNILKNQINDYNSEHIFFRGCNFTNYKHNFNNRYNEYLKKFEDASKLDFIEDEITFYKDKIEQIEIEGKQHFESLQFYIESNYLINHIIKAVGTKQFIITSKKILEYLKKEMFVVKTYGDRLFCKVTKTPEVNKLISDILYSNISSLSAIKYINANTTAQTIDLFLNELFHSYKIVECELLLQASIEDISEAIKLFEHQLDYIYVPNEALPKIQHFIRIIDSQQTIFNVGGFSNVPIENSIKLIYLNNIMVQYYDDFFAKSPEGFGSVSYFQQIVQGLKKHYLEIKNKNPIDLKVRKNLLDEEAQQLSSFLTKDENNNVETIKLNKNTIVQEEGNDFLLSTIKEYLEELEDSLSETNLNKLIQALYNYFKTDNYLNHGDKIIFKNINKKRVGWVLKEIHKAIKPGSLPVEYFHFAKNNISVFENEIIPENNFIKSSFYKSFTTKIDT